MNISIAKTIVAIQEKRLSAIKDTRFVCGKYEYRANYEGGFACYIAVDRREIGRRNFKYFTGIAGYKYATAQDAINAIIDKAMVSA